MPEYNVENQEFTKTPQELIDQTIEKVSGFLNKNFPSHLAFGSGQFTLKRGTSQVMIIVRAFTADDTSVEFISNVVTGAAITPELMKFLLRKNAELHFGAFGLLFDDTISFSYSIAGKNLDENEFDTAMLSVAIIADYYDEMIVEMAGGKRACDVALSDFEDMQL
ncbi:MAG: hypothetical protein QG635_2094 [Bacteroidota bacterium]|nr:hypothetical protein [Bacteroidota bacterium]